MDIDNINDFIDDNLAHFTGQAGTLDSEYLEGILFAFHILKNFIKYDGQPFELTPGLQVTFSGMSEQ